MEILYSAPGYDLYQHRSKVVSVKWDQRCRGEGGGSKRRSSYSLDWVWFILLSLTCFYFCRILQMTSQKARAAFGLSGASSGVLESCRNVSVTCWQMLNIRDKSISTLIISSPPVSLSICLLLPLFGGFKLSQIRNVFTLLIRSSWRSAPLQNA